MPPQTVRKSLYLRVKEWYVRYERRISSIALITGFAVDTLTLQRIDLLFENAILLSYLAIAALGIIVVNLYEGNVVRGRFFGWLRLVAPVVIQFAFGGLFSGFLIFYSRSASLAASWPFILALVAVFFGNELFNKHFVRLGFQMSIFFIALFSYAIFFVPIVLGRIGAWVFIASGVLSLLIMTLFIRGLSYLIPVRIGKSKGILRWSISLIFIAVNLLYFSNVIPPIPLSLKDSGVYHHLERTAEGRYLVREERDFWYEFFLPFDRVHVAQGDSLYVFSSVFAPTRISTDIVHEWEYFDDVTGRWVPSSRVSFPIVGGSDGGYRGYSIKSNLFEGLWRVNIETPRGQVIGRVKFKVKEPAKSVEFQTKTI